MRKIIASIIAAVSLSLGAVAVTHAPAVQAASGLCDGGGTAYVNTKGQTIYGRVGRCTIVNAPYKLWRLSLTCTDGSVKYSGWYAPTTTYKAVLYCTNYPAVPYYWSFGFTTG